MDSQINKHYVFMSMCDIQKPFIIDKKTVRDGKEYHNTFMIGTYEDEKIFFTYAALKNILKYYNIDLGNVLKMSKQEQWNYLQKIFLEDMKFFMMTYIKNNDGYKVINIVEEKDIDFRRKKKNDRK